VPARGTPPRSLGVALRQSGGACSYGHVVVIDPGPEAPHAGFVTLPGPPFNLR
jgi:hypothetical protein